MNPPPPYDEPAYLRRRIAEIVRRIKRRKAWKARAARDPGKGRRVA